MKQIKNICILLLFIGLFDWFEAINPFADNKIQQKDQLEFGIQKERIIEEENHKKQRQRKKRRMLEKYYELNRLYEKNPSKALETEILKLEDSLF